MKRILTILSVVVLAVVALTACVAAPAEAVQTSSAVQIPDALQKAFAGLVFAGVMLGLQALFDAFKLDLRGIGVALAAALSGFVIAQVQGWIDVIPATYDQLVTVVLNIALVVLTGLGYLRAFLHPARARALFYRQ